MYIIETAQNGTQLLYCNNHVMKTDSDKSIYKATTCIVKYWSQTIRWVELVCLYVCQVNLTWPCFSSQVARGNCFLKLTNKAPRTFCVLQAMKKFTGGLGDDDDRETGDTMVWQKYFTKVSIMMYQCIELAKH